MLELWFAELACLKKESISCEKEYKRLTELAALANDHKVSESMLRKADEMLHCSRYSATFHEQNMSIMVLWDDSVAARYCATLSSREKMKVVQRIRDAIGRYPDWYLDEKKKSEKDYRPGTHQ